MICFFKQKTADEVRISDWSSDVCSSDLVVGKSEVAGGKRKTDRLRLSGSEMHALIAFQRADRRFRPARRRQIELRDLISRPLAGVAHRHAHGLVRTRRDRGRSEEHTSELQSLMRISYAVFCLKKKKNRHKPQHT